MKKTAAWILGMSLAAGAHAEPAWLKGMDEAKAAAAGDKEKKGIALFFVDEENGFSNRLEAKLDDPEVKEVFKKLAAVRLDLGSAATEETKALAAGYGLPKAPGLVILNPEGKLLGLTGYQGSDFLAKSIEEILKRTPRQESPQVQGGAKGQKAGGKPGQGGAEGEKNPMRPVAGQMEDVHSDISRQDTGPVVHQKIKSILDELDRLIEQSESSSSSSSSSSSQSKSKDEGQGQGQGEGEGEGEGEGKGKGQGKPKGQKPGGQGAKQSAAGHRGDGENLNNPFASPAASWGERVKIDPEKSAVLKAREGVTPPEYESYVSEYFNRLAREGSDR